MAAVNARGAARRRAAGAAAIALVALSCIGTSPEQAEREKWERLGDGRGEDDDDGDPEHRAGQPCLVCHGEYRPIEESFVIAGTVFRRAGDRSGIEGAEIEMVDAQGHEFTAVSNRTGNFMVRVRGDLGAPNRRNRGRLDIPWAPVFPVHVVVRQGGIEQEMKSLIWREGSCAGCHGPTVEADSAGKVFLQETL